MESYALSREFIKSIPQRLETIPRVASNFEADERRHYFYKNDKDNFSKCLRQQKQTYEPAMLYRSVDIAKKNVVDSSLESSRKS